MNEVILLVEDEALIALHEEQILVEAGYSVIKACNGKQAVETVRDSSRTEQIDLILMDINLGRGMDGTEAAREILSTHRIPVLFLSCHTDTETVEKTEKITSYGYVVKSAGPVVLLTSIKMALRLRQSEQRFQNVLSHVREVAVQGYGADGTTRYWNTTSELIYGYTQEEAVGKKLWDLIIPPDMVSEVKQAVGEMTTTGQPHAPQTLTLMHKDGSPVRVRSSHSVTRNASGEPELFCLDIPLDMVPEIKELSE
ncbi:MAG: response regulator [Spirochaetales bacterium]|nr:response regulator [Spirochaetales bacterium]MCF7938248.1 response regulator [Spirochaetales bacterium]